MNLINFLLPDFWASALINGDRSGLEPEDEAALDAFLKAEGLRDADCLNVSDESGFHWTHDATDHGVLACDCADFTFIAPAA